MEQVQYHQEQMLPELKDLVKKGLFSPVEVKGIVKRRTAFETSLVRRVADRADFLRYVQYEMGLEALRRKRLQRLKIKSLVPSISDYAIIRRQYYIFERAVRKFKADVSLWTQYIELARQNGARGLVGRLCARALQLHPNAPSLSLLSASHEVVQGSPSSARSLLQRGLRFNPESVELWTEYVKMELGYIEGLRRRWDLLGIQDGANAPGIPGENNQARQQVLDGAVVRAVIDSATKSLPVIEMFKSLHDLLRICTSPLVPSLTSHLLELMRNTLRSSPEAMMLRADIMLDGASDSDAFVDRLKVANEELTGAIMDLGPRMSYLYSQWIDNWVSRLKGDNAELAEYLQLSLRKVVRREGDPR
ncbi:hypothetical protein DACRYDRAFT_107108 [Dacryopinax primogenitus]|uniref:U3 small nucleolar RNA-associated protein 6 N-terminal domain-containing protein n=1 Tax=Dacryopinax primogenitus (strain DJM 731) TaxID=1858805 RepID=M5FWA6_DACPD|nr:uncharacterized protein DACRYDRAFT_107108 [Dacryopinax primogenitus]EJU02171.1 hypothetical protein DACRYDRAFT_107108 [Dacryopinax primogenitus]